MGNKWGIEELKPLLYKDSAQLNVRLNTLVNTY